MTTELTWVKMLVIAAVGGVAGVAVEVTDVIKGDSLAVGTMTANVQNLNERFGRLEDTVEARFNKIDARFNKVEDKIDKILPILYRLEQKLDPPKGKD